MTQIPTIFVPEANSSAVQKLRKLLGTDAAAVRICVKPNPGAREKNCYVNVRTKIENNRMGTMQLGWAIWQHSHLFIEAEPHSVFNPGDGSAWIDCTPHCMAGGSKADEILFIPNEGASYDFSTTYLPDNIRVPLVDDWRVSKALVLMSETNALVNSVPGIDVPLPQRVKKQVSSLSLQTGMLLVEAMQPQARTPQRSGKIGRNEPCPCGGGKKYKKCHGK